MPAAQARHAAALCAPVPNVYIPTAQEVHVAAPAMALNVPIGQAEQAEG